MEGDMEEEVEDDEDAEEEEEEAEEESKEPEDEVRRIEEVATKEERMSVVLTVSRGEGMVLLTEEEAEVVA
jgi:hypothetical protein